MACKKTIEELDNISFDCNTAFGGIQGIKISDMNKTRIVEIEFNGKDAFSNASEELTIAPEGTVANAQTVQVEVPKLTKEHYEAIETFSGANMNLIVYVLTKANRLIKIGEKFGAFVSVTDADSGASRKEKNRVQITLTGDEDVLASVIDNGKAEYDKLVVSANPTTATNEVRTKRTKIVE